MEGLWSIASEKRLTGNRFSARKDRRSIHVVQCSTWRQSRCGIRRGLFRLAAHDDGLALGGNFAYPVVAVECNCLRVAFHRWDLNFVNRLHAFDLGSVIIAQAPREVDTPLVGRCVEGMAFFKFRVTRFAIANDQWNQTGQPMFCLVGSTQWYSIPPMDIYCGIALQQMIAFDRNGLHWFV